MNSKYQELRNKYDTFIYNSFNISEEDDNIIVVYNFEIEGLTEFTPKWIFKKPVSFDIGKNRELLENIVFNLGMVEVISYLKCVCSKKLIVKASKLSKQQIAWWNKLYINGLGEFFYVNNIVEEMNINNFLEIYSESQKELSLCKKIESLEGNLIPVGGGKDSLVTLDILKDDKNINTCYVVNSRGATEDSIKVSGYEEFYEAKRYIDPRLLELNKQGFLNGHTPFSAILAFSSYLVAVMLERKYIVLSNESSANESNVSGTNINHQYSKSTEFEEDFREYVKKYICYEGPEYFSLLRPLSEWQIVKQFSLLKKCFGVFKSCNVGSKKDIWCENCPKCLYVYIMLSAFLEDSELNKIFKTNMLNEKKLEDIFNGLIYPDVNKPFECVGTKKEINLCINMIINKLEKEGKELPVLLKKYDDKIKNLDKEVEEANKYWDDQNFLPYDFEKIVKRYIGGRI